MWNSVQGVPVPQDKSNIPCLPHNFAFNMWIKTPPAPTDFSWTHIMKESTSYLIHYMLGIPSSPPSTPETDHIKHIHDILILKMEDGHVININHDDLEDALNIIK